MPASILVLRLFTPFVCSRRVQLLGGLLILGLTIRSFLPITAALLDPVVVSLSLVLAAMAGMYLAALHIWSIEPDESSEYVRPRPNGVVQMLGGSDASLSGLIEPLHALRARTVYPDRLWTVCTNILALLSMVLGRCAILICLLGMVYALATEQWVMVIVCTGLVLTAGLALKSSGRSSSPQAGTRAPLWMMGRHFGGRGKQLIRKLGSEWLDLAAPAVTILGQIVFVAHGTWYAALGGILSLLILRAADNVRRRRRWVQIAWLIKARTKKRTKQHLYRRFRQILHEVSETPPRAAGG